MRVSLYIKLILCFFYWAALNAQPSLIEAQRYFDAGQYAEVVTKLESYVALQHEDYAALELLGDAYAHQELWDYAIPNYKILVTSQPKNANYQYKYGGALGMKALSVSKWQALPLVFDAKSAFLNAAELDANHIDTRWALVKLYMQLPLLLGGSSSKALHYANQLQKISVVDGYLAKAYLFEADKDFNYAESYYKKALKIGGSKTCYQLLAEFYLKQGENDKALHVLRMGYTDLKDEDLKHKIEEITQ